MMTFALAGGLEAVKQLFDHIELFSLAESLGGIESLIVHPASMTHVATPKEVMERQGITSGLVRISVGCEDIEDVIADLEEALKPG